MDQHDDLMAAALNAVAAVEAHSSDAQTSKANQPASADKDNLLSLDECTADSLSDDLLSQMDDPLDLLDERNVEDMPDIDFSLSGFGALFEDNSKAEAVDESNDAVLQLGTGNKPQESDDKDNNSALVEETADAVENKSDASEVKAEASEVKAEASEENADPADVKSVLDSGNVHTDEMNTLVAELYVKLDAATIKARELQTENDQLRAIQKQLNERVIRVTADFDNYRKRVVRDQELNKNQAEERIVSAFLPVMDNLERAIGHAKQSDDYQRLLQGVEMIGRMYRDALIKLGCQPFESMGAEFDPVYHDVLQRVIDPEKPHNSVVQVHLRGYKMHDHVLRPALVVVAQHEDAAPEGEN